MSTALDIVRDAPMTPCKPWPRYVLTAAQWSALAAAPVELLAAWADPTLVHALYEDAASDSILAVSVALDAGFYPALSPRWPAARYFERTIHDLWGHMAAGGDDGAWLDHGHWPLSFPMTPRPGPGTINPEPPVFAEVPGEALMQWPIGPVGPGIGAASHLRLTLDGTRIVQAESRLGYNHRGALALMRGKSPRVAARFAARLAGDTTVAHAVAFAKASEAALGVDAPPRAAGLRGLMLQLERIATHLDDLATLAGVLDATEAQARCGLRQEYLRRGLASSFGHRLMMDAAVPGGVAADADPNGLAVLRQVLDALLEELPTIFTLFAAGALFARLSALPGAARRSQVWLSAIALDAEAARELTSDLPEGPISVALPPDSGEGLAHARSARGDVWHWLRLDHGQIDAVFPTDPGWRLWPLAEAALIGAEAPDAAAIRASFGLPVSGMDL